MATTVNLRKLLHRKSWELITPTPASTTSGGFFEGFKDITHPFYGNVFYVNGVSGIYMYNAKEDGWLQLPNSGAAGAFGAGACGEVLDVGTMGGVVQQVPTAGTTTTLVTTRTITRSIAGSKVRVVSGSGRGYLGTVSKNTYGANSTLTVTPASATAFDTTTVFEVYSGSLAFFNAGTAAVGFSIYDLATNTWTAKSVTNLPTAFGTDGQLIATSNQPGNIFGATTVATAGSTSTITIPTPGGVTAPTNSLVNYCAFIASGTGAGQSRTIVSNTTGTSTVLTVVSASTALSAMTRATTGIVTATVASAAALNLVPGRGYTVSGCADTTFNAVYTILTVSGTTITMLGASLVLQATAQTATGQDSWIVNPDSTSVVSIECDPNFIYLMGNAAVTLYKYNIGQNLWSTITPGAARAGGSGAGCTFDLVADAPAWTSTNLFDPLTSTSTLLKQNGRYIYSLRGGGISSLDVYDIVGATWISTVGYGSQLETFTTGSCSFIYKGKIYIQKEGTGRIFVFDVDRNEMVPYATNIYSQSTTVAGDKMFPVSFVDGATQVDFLYTLVNSRTDALRMLMI